jgi:hypothetical protein
VLNNAPGNIWFFKTRAGTVGALQFEHRGQSPSTTRLRYKLVQNLPLPVREPSYQGKTLLDWLADLDCSPPPPSEKGKEAREAIRQMGTNVIPFLLADLGDVDARKQATYDKEDTRPADMRLCQAVWAFDALDSAAKSAIPQLVKLLKVSPGYVPGALAGVGRDALPELMQALTNEVFWVRDNAAADLANAIYRGKISGREALAAWPIAWQNLNYTNPTNSLYEGNTRHRALGLLKAIRTDPMLDYLPDPEPASRQ